jgi:hypothetical protein
VLLVAFDTTLNNGGNPLTTPVLGNLLGVMLKTLYKAHRVGNTVINLNKQVVTAVIYTVTSFPIMKSIKGQAAGSYIFIRNDIASNIDDYSRILAHESKHVEQQYRLGWFGLMFFIKYYWQFFTYTVRNIGILSLALKQMPLEVEAYATDTRNTQPGP